MRLHFARLRDFDIACATWLRASAIMGHRNVNALEAGAAYCASNQVWRVGKYVCHVPWLLTLLLTVNDLAQVLHRV